MRAILAGFGFIAERGHLPTYLERQRRGELELVAVADVSEARLELARRLLPGARLYRDPRNMIAVEAPGADFVDIATPPASHASIARAALEAGLHVLCEKPLTPRASEARELVRVARATGRVLYPVHNYRYSPVARSVAEALAQGGLGRVRTVHVQTFRNTHALGVREWRPDWRRDPATSGGGIAMDHGPHSLYLAFDWLKALPETVTAHAVTLAPGHGEVEDFFSATYRFAQAVLTLQLSWVAGVRKSLYAIQAERGALVVDDDEIEVARQRAPLADEPGYGGVSWDIERSQAASRWMDASHRDWFGALFDGFVDAIGRGEAVGRETLAALRCVEAIEGAYRSIAAGSREVPLRWSEA